MVTIYILISLSLIIGGIATWKDHKWKASMLQELKDIHICVFSANQCQQKLLKLAQEVDEEEFTSYLWNDWDVELDEKISNR